MSQRNANRAGAGIIQDVWMTHLYVRVIVGFSDQHDRTLEAI